MRVLEGDLASWPEPEQGAAVTIGVYDGVHSGHQQLIARLSQAAAARDLLATVVTFRQHPAEVLAPDRVPPQLTTIAQRLRLFRELGVAQVAMLDFNEELRMRSPESFVEDVLVRGLEVRYVSVGEGFRFGRGQSGDVSLLVELGDRHGFEVEPLALAGESAPFSATAIRQALAAGDLDAVNFQLGRRFEVCGDVTAGDGRGRTIGVPTANLELVPNQALPAYGVYAVTAHVDERSHPAVANVGVRPTFDGSVTVLEAHLLDIDIDLYGRSICLEFVERIREERRFDGVEELVTQIRSDIATARTVL